MDLEELSYKEMEGVDFGDIEDDIEIDWEHHCYEPSTHSCDGRCQGAAMSCPLNPWNDVPKMNKKDTIKYFKIEKFDSIYWKKFFDSEEGEKMIKELGEELWGD